MFEYEHVAYQDGHLSVGNLC